MKNSDLIYKEMKEQFETLSGTAICEGGDMSLRIRAFSAELASLWREVEWVKNQAFPQTATGEMLDLHASMRGLCRGEGRPANGVLRFETNEVSTGNISIPAGTICLNPTGDEFITNEPAVIVAGNTHCIVPATAVIPGVSGNAPASVVCYMALAPVGVVRCYNPQPFTGGAEQESDEALRERVIRSYQSLPNGSNTAFYESEALSSQGVAAALVKPKVRGIGTVDIVISGHNGIPSEALISELEEKLQQEREICVDVSVSAPEAVTVPVSVAVDIEEGYEESQVLSAVHSMISNYFDGTLLGKNVLLAKLGSVVFNVEGVTNYAILLPSSDLVVSDFQLPVAGEINVTRR